MALLGGLAPDASEMESDFASKAFAPGPGCDYAIGLSAPFLGTAGPAVSKLILKHVCPRPRIAEGLALAAAEGVHAAMDISDGVGSDLRHILEESGVRAEVDTRRVPVSPELELFCGAEGKDLLECALSGGEDYELLFTVDPEAEKSLSVAHTVIGRITAEPGLKWKGSRRNFTGYKHF
ncbi:MAG: hypothetical protein KBS55_04345 [Bacteroidales bacterium]|nr:hypothetical protein [Candidatus Cryptobacteroides aphodequi]